MKEKEERLLWRKKGAKALHVPELELIYAANSNVIKKKKRQENEERYKLASCKG